MKMKVLEIRDEGTCIPALAIKMVADSPIEEKYLYYRSGYPNPLEHRNSRAAVVLMHLSTQEAKVDPYDWDYARTMKAAHLYITDHFDELQDGQVVDVRVTTFREATVPARPEIWTGTLRDV